MYAIRNADGEYLCRQGNEQWFQPTPIGWAEVTTDLKRAQSMCYGTNGEFVVVEITNWSELPEVKTTAMVPTHFEVRDVA